MEFGDLIQRRWNADGVEEDTAEKRQVVGERRDFGPIHAEFGPVGALADPCAEKRDLVFGQGIALRGMKSSSSFVVTRARIAL